MYTVYQYIYSSLIILEIILLKFFFTIVFFILLCGYSYSGTDDPDSIMFGIRGGAVYPHGYYDDQLDAGVSTGLAVRYTLFNISYLLIENNLLYSGFTLAESSSSELVLYSLGAGPLAYYPGWTYFRPFAGILFNLNYLDLKTIRTVKSGKTFKPGAVIKAGFFIPVFRDIIVEAGAEFSFNELSEKVFMYSSYYAGISYRYDIIPGQRAVKLTKQIEIDDYYNEGIKYFKAGDARRAREYFGRVISYDDNYKDARNYLDIIRINEDRYIKALDLIDDAKYFDAIPMLIEAAPVLSEAGEKLLQVRALLAGEEMQLETEGIKAYEDKEYGKCITIMKQLELINPDNKNLKIYLPRAVNRYNALKKFE